MTATTHALALGLLAGLGVALPLGAISVLLLQTALDAGWRTGAAGATGVALVDLGYAAAALAAGAVLSQALAGRERAVQLVGATVLAAVAVRGLLALRQAGAVVLDAGQGRGRPAEAALTPTAALRRFLALTAINPLTGVYFVVLAAGLGGPAGAAPAIAFALGVFLASWSWQLLLAGAGALAGRRLPPRLRTLAGAAGYLVVLGYAARLAVGG